MAYENKRPTKPRPHFETRFRADNRCINCGAPNPGLKCRYCGSIDDKAQRMQHLAQIGEVFFTGMIRDEQKADIEKHLNLPRASDLVPGWRWRFVWSPVLMDARRMWHWLKRRFTNWCSPSGPHD